jgi:hypothetical protein
MQTNMRKSSDDGKVELIDAGNFENKMGGILP